MKKIFYLIPVILIATLVFIGSCEESEVVLPDNAEKELSIEDREAIIVGDWVLEYVSGGFTGEGYTPAFNSLSINDLMGYKTFCDDGHSSGMDQLMSCRMQLIPCDSKLISDGKVRMEKVKKDKFLSFKPFNSPSRVCFDDPNNWKRLEVLGHTKIVLHDNGALGGTMNDGYNYHFKKKYQE